MIAAPVTWQAGGRCRAMKRRAFLGAAGLGTLAVAARPALAKAEGEAYQREVRPVAAMGVGRGQGFSLSLVFIPADLDGSNPPLPARLVIYDLSGNTLVEDRAELHPFTGATIEYVLPRNERRQQIFGYGFVGADRLPDVY